MQLFHVRAASNQPSAYRWSVDPPLATITPNGLFVAPAMKPGLGRGAIAIEPGLGSFGPGQVTRFVAITSGIAEVRVRATHSQDATDTVSATVLLSEIERSIPVTGPSIPPVADHRRHRPVYCSA